MLTTNAIGKRTAIFACAAYVGTMISGYLQSAALATLDGRHGIAGWRWYVARHARRRIPPNIYLLSRWVLISETCRQDFHH